MALETGIVIEDLNSNFPSRDDQIREGDDHIRLVKSILKTQFPGVDGNGFNTAILANEEELNYLQGCRDNVQDQIDDLGITLSAPVETQMVIRTTNNAVPLGWSRVTDSTPFGGHLMRIVTTNTPQSQGGEHDPVENDRVPSHTHSASSDSHNHTHSASVSAYNHAHTGTISQESHFHNYQTIFSDPGNDQWYIDLTPPSPNVYLIGNNTDPDTHDHTVTIDNDNHTHSVTNSSDNHDHVITVNANTGNNTSWKPYYLDFMLIRKDAV